MSMLLTTAVLQDDFARLEALVEAHREPLRQATADDEATWPLLRRRLAGENFDAEWAAFMDRQARGTMLGFAVIVDGRCLGMTAYIDPDPVNESVEIGATWYHPCLRGAATNPAAKRLLLTHAFDCGARRVQIKADAANSRSLAAIAKLGAVQEGMLRQHMVTWTGRVRDTVVFSVLREEWPGVRDGLDRRLAACRSGRAAPTAASTPAAA